MVKLEDKISGKTLDSCTRSSSDIMNFSTGELFAMCPVDAHPGVAVEPVSDSSRYFILRLLDPSGIFHACGNTIYQYPTLHNEYVWL